MSRERLPARRASEQISFSVERQGVAPQRYEATIGFYPDGRIGEVFLAGGKSGSDRAIALHDGAMALSFALQHGARPEDMRRAFSRDASGTPEGPLGALADILCAVGRGGPGGETGGGPECVETGENDGEAGIGWGSAECWRGLACGVDPAPAFVSTAGEQQEPGAVPHSGAADQRADVPRAPAPDQRADSEAAQGAAAEMTAGMAGPPPPCGEGAGGGVPQADDCRSETPPSLSLPPQVGEGTKTANAEGDGGGA
ncbi:hypothetical protein L0F51_03995 [Afifella sp. H1R]|uniref:TSCPD domain-containing protein n=1 Tax=Afifella sp. H1R TaxID=2908841 RepID=UPI001F1A8B6B|nr:hypothetical protein [Afifella sp. H1R]MCF1502927.1 hypothetical protein [Afifella sp. H1R]